MKTFWTISTKFFNSDNKVVNVIEGAFPCAGTALRERMEYKLGLKGWEGFREVRMHSRQDKWHK